MIKDKYKNPMIRFTEALAETMFKFTQLIMYFAPFAVFAAIAYSIGHMGLDILGGNDGVQPSPHARDGSRQPGNHARATDRPVHPGTGGVQPVRRDPT